MDAADWMVVAMDSVDWVVVALDAVDWLADRFFHHVLSLR